MANSEPIHIKLLSYRSVSTERDMGVTMSRVSTKTLEIYPTETNRFLFALWFPGRPLSGSLCPTDTELEHGTTIHMSEVHKHFEVPVFQKSLPLWIATFELNADNVVFIPLNADIPEPKAMPRFQKLDPSAYDENTQRIRSRMRSVYHVVHAGQFARKPPPNRSMQELSSLAA
jgi:hypothetical protein